MHLAHSYVHTGISPLSSGPPAHLTPLLELSFRIHPLADCFPVGALQDSWSWRGFFTWDPLLDPLEHLMPPPNTRTARQRPEPRSTPGPFHLERRDHELRLQSVRTVLSPRMLPKPVQEASPLAALDSGSQFIQGSHYLPRTPDTTHLLALLLPRPPGRRHI